MGFIYLDNAATTPMCRAAAEAARDYESQLFYNPSALYAPAAQAAAALEGARRCIAASLHTTADKLIFTGGGTESNALAIIGTANRRSQFTGRYITTAAEHPSVLEAFMYLKKRGCEVIVLPVDKSGAIIEGALEQALEKEVTLISIQHVNSETGAIHDVGKIARRVHTLWPRAKVHADGVQAYLRLPAPNEVDFYSVSAHKVHGPKGVGALKISQGTQFPGMRPGGGQEKGLRSGTENMLGIMGMEAAVRDFPGDAPARMQGLKQTLWQNISQAGGVCINGPALEDGAPHVLNIGVEGVRAEVLLHAMEERGVLIGTGSACSSRKQGGSAVLRAMGLETWAILGAVRFSLSPYTGAEDIARASQAFMDSVRVLRGGK
nr:cysteine desulfurase family protein [bacterium]